MVEAVIKAAETIDHRLRTDPVNLAIPVIPFRSFTLICLCGQFRLWWFGMAYIVRKTWYLLRNRLSSRSWIMIARTVSKLEHGFVR